MEQYLVSDAIYVFMCLINAAFHEGTFQNCNFHVVNNFSKRIIDCMVIEVAN